MARTVRLWVREDGEEPKAIPGDGSLPPGPGLVVDVEARSSREARQLLSLATGPEVLEVKDPSGWLEQRQARRLVKPVAAYALDPAKRLHRVPFPVLKPVETGTSSESTVVKGGDA